ncbi:succinate dehydrogenase subunit 6, mitochondrial [Tanacetum coccineum]
MATQDETSSAVEGFKTLWSDRFRIVKSYTPFIRRDSPLPPWSDADVHDFFAFDPIHGPVLLTTHQGQVYTFIVTPGASVCWESNVKSIYLPLEEKVFNTIDECVELYTFYAEIGGAITTATTEQATGTAATEQATNAS